MNRTQFGFSHASMLAALIVSVALSAATAFAQGAATAPIPTADLTLTQLNGNYIASADSLDPSRSFNYILLPKATTPRTY